MLFQAINNGYLQVTVVGGRISFAGSRVISPTMVNEPERLSMRADGDFTVIQYQCKSAEEDFFFEVRENVRFTLRRASKSEGCEVELRQIPEAPLEATFVRDGRQEHFQAHSLWHLLISQKDLSLQLLVPVLDRLRPGWNLADKAQQVEDEVLRTVTPEHQQNRRRWADLVRQLADDRFSRREAADRELRSAGGGVMAYLDRLDFRRLEPEQQVRIRSILGSLMRDSDDDTPEQVAATLVNDPSIWLAFLGRPDVSVRRTAARQLEASLHKPLPLDPDAGPDRGQLQRLGELLDKK